MNCVKSIRYLLYCIVIKHAAIRPYVYHIYLQLMHVAHCITTKQCINNMLFHILLSKFLIK